MVLSAHYQPFQPPVDRGVARQARDVAGRMAAGLGAVLSAMAERAQQPRPSDTGEAKL